MGSFFSELKRRNVVRVGLAYIVVAWLVTQIAETLFPVFGTPDWVFKTLVLLVAIGFPFAVVSLCQYDARKFTGTDIVKALKSHEDTFKFPLSRFIGF